jgi:hypothetical protein
MTEYFDTGLKKGRGLARATMDLIKAMRPLAEAAQPITGRGVGYKLFTAGFISSMDEMPRVYRALKSARERGYIPWGWIVDETRGLERSLNLGRPGRILSRRRPILSPRLLGTPARPL